MALSICSFSSLVPFPSTKSNNKIIRRHAQARPSSVSAAQTSPDLLNYQRRSANYPPTLWEDRYIQSLPIDFKEESLNSRIANLLEEVKRNLFGKEKKCYVEQLELVDHHQQLGVAYHFEKEIHNALTHIHNSLQMVIDRLLMEDSGLYGISLLFRLLREHGFSISTDVFNNFKDEEGRFKASLRKDIKGILSLYEASFLAFEGETEMDDAKDFATKCLRDVEAELTLVDQPLMKEKVSHALELPLHWRMRRLHTRWFICQSEREEGVIDASLLQLAKLDFNRLQGIYKSELKEMSRWWMDLGLGESLGFARDRLVENYFWTVGWAFEPKYGKTREAMAKANCFITTVDDVYDIYGTLEELELFTDAVNRWDARAIEQLPGYMQICFLALFNTANDTAYKTLKRKGVDILPYLQRAWADLCNAYLVEAKWYHGGYTPSLQEYLRNACISISGHVGLTHAYCTSEDISKEALERFNFYPDAVYHSSLILRLCDDLATSTAELQRGDVPKAIQCCMNDDKVSEDAARSCIQEMIASAWKQLNSDRVGSSSYEESFKRVALNIPRMSQCMYQHGDGHGEPGAETKDRVIALLIEPIPL